MNQQHQESIDKVDEQIDNDNSNTDKVTTAIESHGNFIIEGLKKLFIPSDEYFKAYLMTSIVGSVKGLGFSPSLLIYY